MPARPPGAFDDVGGFAAGYDYGLEDVDLCLKLRAAGGRLVYDGRAALWHHESATRAADAARRRERVAHNREVYLDTWGPRTSSARRSSMPSPVGSGSPSEPFHVAIAVTSHDPEAGFGDWYTGHELGDALAALGWRVTYLERAADEWYRPDASVEAVITLLNAFDVRRLPRHVVTMAWVRSWPERWLDQPWFDDYDLVFGSSERIVDMVRSRTAKVATLLPIATNPDRFGRPEPRPDLACDVLFVGGYWGQHRAVVDALPALADRGITVRVHGRGWDAVPGFEAIDRGFLAYDDIPRAYASARIVVDDAAVPVNGYRLGEFAGLRRPRDGRHRGHRRRGRRPRAVRRVVPDVDRPAVAGRSRRDDPGRAQACAAERARTYRARSSPSTRTRSAPARRP